MIQLRAAFIALFIASVVRATDTSSTHVAWLLEDYNDWNLPFAKTVEIQGNENGAYKHTLGAQSYRLEVDPSALFTVLFLRTDEFEDYTEADLVPLNYTFFGDQSEIHTYSGVWTSVTMLIPEAIGFSTISHTVNVVIFIAIGEPPDSGLRGTLGLCISPQTTDWKEVSIMAQLEAKYQWPSIYISLGFTQKNGVWEGLLEFAD